MAGLDVREKKTEQRLLLSRSSKIAPKIYSQETTSRQAGSIDHWQNIDQTDVLGPPR